MSTQRRGLAPGGERAKRILDVVLAGSLFVVGSPVFACVSLAVALESPGGVLYRVTRVGRGGRTFAMLKFRKMHRDATGPPLTATDDPRFTRMGRLLARSRLDELPQLWNVIRGDMSLVGPRPEDPKYTATAPEAFEYVLRVRPGITGLTQLVYRDEHALLVGDDPEAEYVSTLLPRKLAIDRRYVETRDLALDIRILWWTARILVAGGDIDLSGDRPRLSRAPRS